MNYTYMGPNTGSTLIILLLAVWSIVWKGYALWLSAKRSHKGWFVAILILNSIGILEIIYVFKVANKKWDDVKKDFSKVFSSIK